MRIISTIAEKLNKSYNGILKLKNIQKTNKYLMNTNSIDNRYTNQKIYENKNLNNVEQKEY